VASGSEKLRNRPELSSPVASGGPPHRVRNQQVVGSSPTAGSRLIRTQWTPHRLACGWATSVEAVEDGGVFSLVRANG